MPPPLYSTKDPDVKNSDVHVKNKFSGRGWTNPSNTSITRKSPKLCCSLIL